jgi:hypothetical protein
MSFTTWQQVARPVNLAAPPDLLVSLSIMPLSFAPDRQALEGSPQLDVNNEGAKKKLGNSECWGDLDSPAK